MSGQTQSLFVLQPNSAFQNLNAEQTTRLNKATALGADVKLAILNFGNFASSQLNGSIAIDDPKGDCGQVFFKGTRIEYVSETDFYFYGEVEQRNSCDCSEGYLSLTSKNGAIFGTLQIEHTMYSIEDISGGKSLLVEVKENVHNCAGAILPPQVQNETTNDRGPGDNCDIKILVLHTNAAAAAQVGTISTTITAAVNATNTAFLNSNISTIDARIVLSGGEQLFSGIDETSKSFNNVLVLLSNNLSVAALRNQYNADLVFLMVNPSIMQTTNVAGVAYLGPSNSNGFSVVRANSVNNGFVFSHELGHLLGANHEEPTSSMIGADPVGGTGPAHAHTWVKIKKRCFRPDIVKPRATIMFSSSAGNPAVIPYFSNPSVDYENLQTGLFPLRDNESVIKSNACAVANFRSGDNMLKVSTLGFHDICNFAASEEITTIVSGAPGPFQYVWHKSSSATNWGNPVGYSSSYTTNSAGFPVGSTIFLRVTVTHPATGVTVVAYHNLTVVASNGSNHPLAPCNRSTDFIPQSNQNLKWIAPNPTSGAFEFHYKLDEASKVGLDLFDISGRFIKNLKNCPENAGEHSEYFNEETLASGLYMLRFHQNGITTSHLLTIHH